MTKPSTCALFVVENMDRDAGLLTATVAYVCYYISRTAMKNIHLLNTTRSQWTEL